MSEFQSAVEKEQ